MVCCVFRSGISPERFFSRTDMKVFQYRCRRARGDDERGLAIVEFAVALPFLTVLMLSALDVGQLLIQYIQMSAAVREGVRVASSTTDIETFYPYSQLTSDQNCESAQSSGPDVKRHQQIQRRVMQVMGQRDLLIESSKICVESGLSKNAAGEDNIYVKLNTSYTGFFPVFDGIELEVEALAPYLS